MGTLTDVQRVAYENDVQHEYQSRGSQLENTVRLKDAPNAGTYNFRLFGALDMVPRGDYRSLLEAIQTNNTLVPCTASDFVLPVMTDDFEQAKSGGEAPMEQKESAIAMALAMHRQRDYSVIAALDAGTPTLTPITAGSGLTVAKLLEAIEWFDKYEMRAGGDPVGGGIIHTLITEKEHQDLLADALTQDIDTSNFKSLVQAKIGEFAGHNFHLIGSGRGALGLPAPSTRTCFSYVKSAIGQAVSIAPKIESSRQALYVSELTTAMLSLGSVVINPIGFVQYNVT